MFHYRVAGVAVTPTHVLLHHYVKDTHWSLPGGHVEAGESAAIALRREMQEETGLTVKVGRLLWVMENFFNDNGKDVNDHHELGLYFLMHFAPGSKAYRCETFIGLEAFEPATGSNLRLEFRWFPRKVEVLRALPVLPPALQEGLIKLPRIPRHVLFSEW